MTIDEGNNYVGLEGRIQIFFMQKFSLQYFYDTFETDDNFNFKSVQEKGWNRNSSNFSSFF